MNVQGSRGRDDTLCVLLFADCSCRARMNQRPRRCFASTERNCYCSNSSLHESAGKANCLPC